MATAAPPHWPHTMKLTVLWIKMTEDVACVFNPMNFGWKKYGKKIY